MLINEEVLTKLSEYIEKKIAVENITTLFQVALLYKLDSLSKLALSYIERCFTIVTENQTFLELDYNPIAKILTSYELNLHSEIEVINAANLWLKYNINERSKYAKQLLLTVRLPLLSDHALKNILNNTSSFTENDECVEILKEILANKESFFKNKSSNYYTTRYCNQNKFNILTFGGCDKVLHRSVCNVNQFNGSDFKKVKSLAPMVEGRKLAEGVCLKGEIYVFGGHENDIWKTSVDKYSPSTNTWKTLCCMYDDREAFCACAFMDDIFIIGGSKCMAAIDSSVQLDTKEGKWKDVSRMNETRFNAACAVYEGKVVVSGGFNLINFFLTTVEVYDHIADEWSYMPNMIYRRSEHRMVVVRNKLFAVSPYIWEVFDQTSNNFVSFESPKVIRLNSAIPIGNKILVIDDMKSSIFCYDVDKDEWSEEPCNVSNELRDFSSVKVPWY